MGIMTKRPRMTAAGERSGRRAPPWRVAALTVAMVAAGCGGPATEGGPAADGAAAPDSADSVMAEGYLRPSAEAPDLTSGDTVPGHPSWTEQDFQVLGKTAQWAWQQGLEKKPVGERMAILGQHFVGTPYIPRTLEAPGSEHLVINLRALDCVTFVENMMALAHFVRLATPQDLERRDPAMDLYAALLTDIRYRDGKIDGYPSRLHYFSEWIANNAKKGYVVDMTRLLGGVRDTTAIDFMSNHRDAYDQLTDEGTFQAIRRVEERLSSRPRYYIPEGLVAQHYDGIHDGDVLAMTSTLPGLDVAHTGLALQQGGAPHLLNAPLVGKDVEISEKPLAQRLAGISKQDGMMVARPRETDAIAERIRQKVGATQMGRPDGGS